VRHDVVVDDVAETVRRCGGVCTWRELRLVHRKREVLGAVGDGVIERAARGRYVLPDASVQFADAQRLSGTLSGLSAAVHHGWKVKTPSAVADITVRAKRRRLAGRIGDATVHWADIPLADIVHGVTTPLRTVVDCARRLPFDAALAVVDSALRSGSVGVDEVRGRVAALRGPGSAAARRVAAHADARAANPLESVLRALCIEEGYDLTPQLVIADSGMWACVDLGSAALRLAVEADGFEHHGTRRGLRKDCRRHTELAVFGWSSLRFAYEDVMHDQPWTRWALRSWRTTRAGGVPESPPRRLAA
jgi:very-short-patch-repair endonuclease